MANESNASTETNDLVWNSKGSMNWLNVAGFKPTDWKLSMFEINKEIKNGLQSDYVRQYLSSKWNVEKKESIEIAYSSLNRKTGPKLQFRNNEYGLLINDVENNTKKNKKKRSNGENEVIESPKQPKYLSIEDVFLCYLMFSV